MIEGFTTILLIGFTAGFLFAMPIAGPISIIITSNALKGSIKYCNRVAIGASMIESLYALIAVFGLSLLLSLYSFLIPYLLILGAIFIIIIGFKIIQTNIKLDNLDTANDNVAKNGGLRTGIIVNLTNPSFFFGVIASSFLVLSFASSLGLNTGGLDLLVHENVVSIREVTGEDIIELDTTYISKQPQTEKPQHSSYTLFLSLTYASALGLGGFTWLFILAKLLEKYRTKIRIEILNWIIRALGIVLYGIAFYLLWKSYDILLN